MPENKPHISIVVSGRNDNYGGDFYARLQNQVSSTAFLAKKFKVVVEYVLVNYNPVSNRPSLRDEIEWPNNNPYFILNLITIPATVHEILIKQNIRKPIPLFEFIAKNAGIRNSRGDFILTTNADIIFDPGIFSFLAQTKLKKNTLYRCNRLDYSVTEPFDFERPRMYFKKLRKHVFKYFLRGLTYEWHSNLPFDLKYGLLRVLNHMKFLTRKAIRACNPILESINMDSWQLPPESFYYSNASGDFLLIDRDWYYKVRGFPEDTYISTHTDSLLVAYAHVDGLPTVLIPGAVYHQEHGRRFKFDTGMGDADMKRMYKRLQKEIFVMNDWQKIWIHNDEFWGLEQYKNTFTNFMKP